MPVLLSDPHGYAESACMLRAVLEGDSYRIVAQRHGVSRSVVERRIKDMAVHLIHTVGIEGVSLGSVMFVRRLRQQRAAVMRALEQSGPASRGLEAAPLRREDLHLAAARLRTCSAHVAHDLAVFYLLFSTGLRPLELARLTVRDCVSDAGDIHRVTELRAEVTHNGQPRPLYLSSVRVVAALSAYLQERQRRGHGLGESTAYAGLCPDSALFLSPYGQAYSPHRHNTVDGRPRLRCRGLQEALRQLFRDAGLAELCSRDARRTVAALLYARGADEGQVGLLLGIGNNSAVRALLRRPRPRLSELTAELL